jgi:chorismate mutase / prephenate dehydratase
MTDHKRPKSNSSAGKKRRTASSHVAPSASSADSSNQPTLASLRRELDAIDNEVLAAINRRGVIAQQIGVAKQADKTRVYDAAREAEVLARAIANNAGPLSADTVRAVFRELISGTRALQTPIRVAYLGPEFTFSHLAAIERFGQTAELVPVSTIAAVFEEVERGQVRFGVVPMENSTDGRVSDTLDCFSRSPARICGELPLRIHHCLLGSGSRDGIRKVYSKPQPLSQCRNWLAKHLPQATLAEVGSTAAAAQTAQGDPSIAAIASRQAGVHYELPCIVQNIEDNPDNITRFAIISVETGPKTGHDKTALMVEIAHRSGALADAMAIFKRNRLNMTWIESFPIPGHRGRYLFFVEFVGHHDEPRAGRAIETLAKHSLRLEVLGSYAQAEPVG